MRLSLPRAHFLSPIPSLFSHARPHLHLSSANALGSGQFLAMPEAGTDLKSPKPRRPLPKADNPPSRQVHFDDPNSKTKPSSAAAQEPKNTQPDSHPQVGPPPLPNLNRPPSDQWFTAANPTRSINLPAAQPPYAHFPHLHPHPPFHQQSFAQGVTYFPGANMGDYQNCAPPPTGVNFQPPVPDTTFGPMPHVYVPRFDGGPVYGGGGVVHVSPPYSSFLSPSSCLFAAPSVRPTITVVSPKTFYVRGYNYYASAGCFALLSCFGPFLMTSCFGLHGTIRTNNLAAASGSRTPGLRRPARNGALDPAARHAQPSRIRPCRCPRHPRPADDECRRHASAHDGRRCRSGSRRRCHPHHSR